MGDRGITHREVVAHHEAAHAVLAVELGLGLLEVGIDVIRFNETGGIGLDGCRFFLADLSTVEPSDLEDERRRLAGQIDCNGTVLAAGPAADAKLRAEDPWAALKKQQSDFQYMQALLRKARLSHTPEDEQTHLRRQLALAVEALDDPAIWSAVETVAQVVLRKGPLKGAEIEAIVEPLLRRPESDRSVERAR